MIKILYLLFLCINMAVIACCVRGLYKVMTIYVQHLQIMVVSTGYNVHRTTPCPVLLVIRLSYS